MSVADAYAAAFLDVAKAEGALERVENDLLAFSRAYEESPQLQHTLTNQAIPVERRHGIVEDLLGGNAHPVTVHLISLLVGTGRAKDLPAVTAGLIQRSAAERGTSSGEVRTAIPLGLEQQQRLTAAVEKATGKRVSLKFLVDPSVIGGVVTQVDDTVIDGSIRTRLKYLREAI